MVIDTLSLIQQIGDYEPNIVEIIFNYVFIPCSEDREGKCKYIYVIPKPGKTSIDSESFYTNKSLQWAIIDKSVKSIDFCAFEECSNLTHVTIPNSVEIISYCAFNECTNLTHINIPNSVELINCEAFLGCINLEKVFIPSSVKLIDFYSFYTCSKLQEASIPKHLEQKVKENKIFPPHTKIIIRPAL